MICLGGSSRGGIFLSLYITESCISCSACLADCPTDAISVAEGEFAIDADRCVGCWGFLASQPCLTSCPVPEAIDVGQANSSVDYPAQFKRLYPYREPQETENWQNPIKVLSEMKGRRVHE